MGSPHHHRFVTKMRRSRGRLLAFIASSPDIQVNNKTDNKKATGIVVSFTGAQASFLPETMECQKQI
jgi:hypothetical protein